MMRNSVDQKRGQKILRRNMNVTPKNEMAAVVRIKVKAIVWARRSYRLLRVHQPAVSVAAPMRDDPTMKVANSAWVNATTAMAALPYDIGICRGSRSIDGRTDE